MNKEEDILKQLIFTPKQELVNTILNLQYKLNAVKKHCIQEISASSYQYKKRYKLQDLVYKMAHERILKILDKEWIWNI